MPEIILHQYEPSPFGTAMRLALGYKGMAWKSVEAPMISPKPELSALTGGYERIPVLQIGADIYCDTDCITDAIENTQPQPSLYPEPLGRAAKMIALWSGNSWFMPAVGTALGVNPDVTPEAFWEDRAKRFGMDPKTFLPAVPHLVAQFHAGAAFLRAALADGREFMAGSKPGHADFALYVNVRFVGISGTQPSDLGDEIAAWFARVEGIGFGDFEEWNGQQAIDHARESEPAGGHIVVDGKFSAGMSVRVKTESPDPAFVEGKLVGLDDEHIVIERISDEAGRVHVHFPRFGQILKPV